MKRLIAVCLALMLLMPAALAAPVRDVAVMEVTLDSRAGALLETMVSAAVLRGVPALEAGETPPAALCEGAMTMGLYRGYLGDGNTMTPDQRQAAYDALFTFGTFTPASAPECPCITVTEQGWAFDFSSLAENPAVGAHVYYAAWEEENVRVLCDVYLCDESDRGKAPEMMPDNALTWLCAGDITLREAPDKPFGYTVSAYKLSDDYQAGALSEWKTVDNTEYEYSVNLPNVLGLCDDTPACMVWETADGSARLTIQSLKQDCTFDQMLADFTAEAGNETVSEHREFGFFTAVGDGIFEMYLRPEGLENYYVLTLIFPPERQSEYTLYAEFITNSFTVWGAANG